MNNSDEKSSMLDRAPSILALTGSPMTFLALCAIICNSVFSIGAAVLGDPASFKYCIHMFLAVVGVLALTALWSPRSLYHPKDLKGLPPEEMPKNRPWIPTAFLFLGLFGYMAYQLIDNYSSK
jgi:hypothetical protein